MLIKYCLALDYPRYEILLITNLPLNFSYKTLKVILTNELGQAYKKDLGLSHASGDICAFIDDDAYPSKEWIKNAIKYFDELDIVAVGGPGITPSGDSLMQKASGLIYSLPIGSGNITYRYVAKKTSFVNELPGYNLFVRKSFLKEIGGINVKYRSGEDTILSNKICKAGKKFKYAPDVIVYHHRRPLFVSHLKQVSNYALHRGYFIKNYPVTSAKLYYMLPSIFLIAFVTWFFFSVPIPILRLPLFIVITSYAMLSFALSFIRSKSLKLSILVAIGIPLTHLAYAIFFIKGLLMKNLGERPSY